MTISETITSTADAPASIFDDLHSSYDQVYSEGTLQTDFVRKLISLLSPGCSVLDIGCASGVPNGVLLEKAGLEITGLDFSEKMVAEARKNVRTGRFVKADAKSYTPTKPFDAIVCSLALLTEPSAWNYSLAFRVSHWLKPGGLLLFGTIDFNDFPVAPGYPVDPTGMTFYHTFMGTTIRDSTFEAGDWIRILRRAGLKLVECEQRRFDPRPGQIEPEAQCFFLARRTEKHALLGPYMHPYKHYPTHGAKSETARKAVLSRRIIDASRSVDGAKVWNVTAEEMHLPCPTGTTKVVLDWLLGSAEQSDIVACVKTWAEQSPSLKQVEVILAAPSNQTVDLVNSVLRFLGQGTQHHGAIISEFLKRLGLSDTHEDVRIELIPARLSFADASQGSFVKTAAEALTDFWSLESHHQDHAIGKYLIKKRLEAMVAEFQALGQADVCAIGFDCVGVTIDL